MKLAILGYCVTVERVRLCSGSGAVLRQLTPDAPPVTDAVTECPSCGRRYRVRPNGKLRAHKRRG